MAFSKNSNRFNQHVPLMKRFEASYITEPNSGCWIWTGSIVGHPDKRPRINLNGRSIIAYRIAYELFRGPIPKGKMCCHTCDVSICVNPHHLFLGTAKENGQDAARKGRLWQQKNPEHHRANVQKLGRSNTWSKGSSLYLKLSQADRENAIARHNAGESYKNIAKDFNVTRQCIYLTCKRAAQKALEAAK